MRVLSEECLAPGSVFLHSMHKLFMKRSVEERGKCDQVGVLCMGSREAAPRAGDEQWALSSLQSLSAHRGAFREADHWSPWQLGQEGKVPLQSAHLYYNVTEKVRRVMESYFRLETPLYFSYSHLVCRTAIEGGPPSARQPSLSACCAGPGWMLRTWRRTGYGPFHPSLGTNRNK